MTPEQAIALGTEMVKLLALDPDELGDDVLDSTGRIMVKLPAVRKAVLESVRIASPAMIEAGAMAVLDRDLIEDSGEFIATAAFEAMIQAAIAEGER